MDKPKRRVVARKSGVPVLPIALGLGGAAALVLFAASRKPTVIERPAPAPAVAVLPAVQPASVERRDEPRHRLTPAEPDNEQPSDRQPAQSATSAPAVAASTESADIRANYVEPRTKELTAEMLDGFTSDMVSDDQIERFRAIAAEQAGKEWRLLERIIVESERLGQNGEADVYRKAADVVWGNMRDLARIGAQPATSFIVEALETAAGRIRLQQRIR